MIPPNPKPSGGTKKHKIAKSLGRFGRGIFVFDVLLFSILIDCGIQNFSCSIICFMFILIICGLKFIATRGDYGSNSYGDYGAGNGFYPGGGDMGGDSSGGGHH